MRDYLTAAREFDYASAAASTLAGSLDALNACVECCDRHAESGRVVRGPRDAKGADAQSFDASVDVAGLKPGLYELPVRIVIPPRVGWTRIEPAEVRVRIQ